MLNGLCHYAFPSHIVAKLLLRFVKHIMGAWQLTKTISDHKTTTIYQEERNGDLLYPKCSMPYYCLGIPGWDNKI